LTNSAGLRRLFRTEDEARSYLEDKIDAACSALGIDVADYHPPEVL
jgi:hypothetical protein